MEHQFEDWEGGWVKISVIKSVSRMINILQRVLGYLEYLRC